MKRVLILMLGLGLALALLSACAQSGPPAAGGGAGASIPVLRVSGDEISKSYTRASLETLPPTQSVFKEVTYRGVTVYALLGDAGFDPAQVKVVKAVAADGYTVNYDLAQVMADGVILAYSRADGDLAAEDGAFRMVLPKEEGKLNLRMLSELQVIK